MDSQLVTEGETAFWWRSELTLRPWTEPSLRRWLDDLGIAPGEGDGRERIRAVTGAWASPLRNFADRCQAESHRWQQHLTELATELLEDSSWGKTLGAPI